MKKQKEGQVVYVLLNKKAKSFFIAAGSENTLRETYRHHMNGRRDRSRQFVLDCAPDRPCLFILERIDPETGINYMIVWLRILLENGYTAYIHPDFIDMSAHLYMYNQAAYEARKDIDLERKFACEGCCVPDYRGQSCALRPSSKPRQTTPKKDSRKDHDQRKVIRLRFSEEEHAYLKRQAQKHNMPVSHYIIEAAKNPTIIEMDYRDIDAHTQELKEVSRGISRIAFTIEATNTYLDRQIQSVVDLMYGAWLGQKKLLAKINRQAKELRKAVEKDPPNEIMPDESK